MQNHCLLITCFWHYGTMFNRKVTMVFLSLPYSTVPLKHSSSTQSLFLFFPRFAWYFTSSSLQKAGGRSPSSNSSMSYSTPPAFYRRLSQASLLTLLSCGPNAKASLISITNGTFTPIPAAGRYCLFLLYFPMSP